MTVGYQMNDDYDQTHAQAAQQAAVNAAVGVAVPQVVQSPAQPVAWSAGLCDCWNFGNLCCNVYWCTPCMLGRNHTAVMEGVPDVMNVGVCAGLLAAAFVGGAVGVGVPLATGKTVPFVQYIGYCAVSGYTMWQRQQMRERYNIAGDGCNDCMVSWCCTTCATGQHHMELSRRGVNPGSVCCEIAPPPAPAVVQQPAYAVPQQTYAVPQQQVYAENVYAQQEMVGYPQQQ